MERDRLDLQPLFEAPVPMLPFEHAVEGRGFQIPIGRGVVEIFPATRVARASFAGDEVRLANVIRVRADAAGLDIDCETEEYRSAIHMSPDSVLVWKVRRAGTHAAMSPTTSTETDQHQSVTDTAIVPSSTEDSEADRQRVTLVGRLGYAPKFRTTPKGTLVGSFSLGAHPEQGKTEWHQVVTFGSRAEKLQEAAFGKGDEVQVVGYPHERERTDKKTGETKTVTEIYAAVVKTPKETESSRAVAPPSHEEREAPHED
jgi:single-stranded DNA-binding protein